MNRQNVLVTGSLPPPVGGVTVFLKYFYEAGESIPSVTLLPFEYAKLLSPKYGIIHINASNPLKRFIYIFLGKLFFKKVFFVKHGGVLNLNNIFVKLSLVMADGVFCLNNEVLTQLEAKGVNSLKHSTIFKENGESLRLSYPRSVMQGGGVTKILFYLNNSHAINGVEIYGGDFIVSCLDALVEDYELTVVDLSKSYKDYFLEYSGVTYYSEPQDFKALLSKSDIYIRPTSSDGMSVAILEAGLLGVKCLASDAVERPSFVSLYKFGNVESFLNELELLARMKESEENTVHLSSISEVFGFMGIID